MRMRKARLALARIEDVGLDHVRLEDRALRTVVIGVNAKFVLSVLKAAEAAKAAARVGAKETKVEEEEVPKAKRARRARWATKVRRRSVRRASLRLGDAGADDLSAAKLAHLAKAVAVAKAKAAAKAKVVEAAAAAKVKARATIVRRRRRKRRSSDFGVVAKVLVRRSSFTRRQTPNNPASCALPELTGDRVDVRFLGAGDFGCVFRLASGAVMKIACQVTDAATKLEKNTLAQLARVDPENHLHVPVIRSCAIANLISSPSLRAKLQSFCRARCDAARMQRVGPEAFKLVQIMENGGQTLFTMWRDLAAVDEAQLYNGVVSLLQGFAEVRAADVRSVEGAPGMVTHQDIKPTNMVCGHRGRGSDWRLIDWGTSAVVPTTMPDSKFATCATPAQQALFKKQLETYFFNGGRAEYYYGAEMMLTRYPAMLCATEKPPNFDANVADRTIEYSRARCGIEGRFPAVEVKDLPATQRRHILASGHELDTISVPTVEIFAMVRRKWPNVKLFHKRTTELETTASMIRAVSDGPTSTMTTDPARLPDPDVDLLSELWPHWRNCDMFSIGLILNRYSFALENPERPEWAKRLVAPSLARRFSTFEAAVEAALVHERGQWWIRGNGGRLIELEVELEERIRSFGRSVHGHFMWTTR